MTRQEVQEAMSMARTRSDLHDVDTLPLWGLAKPGFPTPTYCSMECAAAFLQWQVICLDGSTDEMELANLVPLLRKRVLIV